MVSLKIEIIFSICLVLAFGNLTDHAPVKYVYSEHGGTVLLPCEEKLDEGYKNNDCIWTSSDKAGQSDMVIAARSSILSPDPRFKIVGDWRNGNCSLQISSVKEDDKKTYSCKVYPRKFHVSKVQLLLGVKPDFPRIFYEEQDVTSKKHVEALNGEDIKLRCVVKNGDPLANISWVGFDYNKNCTNTSQVGETSSILLLTSTDMPNEDERTFVCKAEHPLFPGFSATVNVSIGYPYAIKKVKFSRLKIILGELLKCNAVGIPGPDKYIWKIKKGQDWTEITSSDAKSNAFTPTQEGIYKCSAKNYLNTEDIPESEEATVEVAIKEVEISPLKISLGESFTCNAVGIPGPDKYIWKRKEGQVWTEITNSNAKSNVFTPTHEGIYKCSAINYLNTDRIPESKEATVEDKYEDAVKEVKISPLKISLGESLTCNADGIPRPEEYIWKIKKEQDWTKISDAKLKTFKPTEEGKYKCSAKNYLNTKGIPESEEAIVEDEDNNADKMYFTIFLILSSSFLAILLSKM